MPYDSGIISHKRADKKSAGGSLQVQGTQGGIPVSGVEDLLRPEEGDFRGEASGADT